MENIKDAFSNAFNTSYSKISFLEFDDPKEDVRCHVDFFNANANNGADFLRFKMTPNQPLFSSPYLNSVFAFSKFNKLFEINKTIREKIYELNQALTIFFKNKHFSRFLMLSNSISKNSIYMFEKPVRTAYAMSLFDKDGCRITSSVNGSYRYMTGCQLYRYFGVTRTNKIVTFPILKFIDYLSLYYDTNTNTFYKIPDNLFGMTTVDDIIEKSPVLTDADVNEFVDNLIMMYLKNLHPEIYAVVMDMSATDVSNKIDLLMMQTI